jgi:hypothetical protein
MHLLAEVTIRTRTRNIMILTRRSTTITNTTITNTTITNTTITNTTISETTTTKCMEFEKNSVDHPFFILAVYFGEPRRLSGGIGLRYPY